MGAGSGSLPPRFCRGGVPPHRVSAHLFYPSGCLLLELLGARLFSSIVVVSSALAMGKPGDRGSGGSRGGGGGYNPGGGGGYNAGGGAPDRYSSPPQRARKSHRKSSSNRKHRSPSSSSSLSSGTRKRILRQEKSRQHLQASPGYVAYKDKQKRDAEDERLRAQSASLADALKSSFQDLVSVASPLPLPPFPPLAPGGLPGVAPDAAAPLPGAPVLPCVDPGAAHPPAAAVPPPAAVAGSLTKLQLLFVDAELDHQIVFDHEDRTHGTIIKAIVEKNKNPKVAKAVQNFLTRHDPGTTLPRALELRARRLVQLASRLA